MYICVISLPARQGGPKSKPERFFTTASNCVVIIMEETLILQVEISEDERRFNDRSFCSVRRLYLPL